VWDAARRQTQQNAEITVIFGGENAMGKGAISK
jgi:hypothetical protein